MIKKGLKNFFVNLKYYFTPLGMLALGVILSLSIAIPVIKGSLRELVDYVTSLEGVQLDFSAFLRKIFDSILSLEWRNPTKAIAEIFSSDWLNKTFSDSIFALVQDMESVAEEILAKIGSCVSTIKYAVFVVLIFAAVGIVCGFFLTKYLIRREIAQRTLWKAFLVSILDAIIMAALPVLSVYLSLLWRPAAYIVIVLMPLLWGFILLFEAYLIQGVKKVKMREVLTAKNSLKLLLTNILILLISSAITSVISALAGELVGMLLGFPFLMIALIVCGLNAEAYVKEIAESKEQNK